MAAPTTRATLGCPARARRSVGIDGRGQGQMNAQQRLQPAVSLALDVDDGDDRAFAPERSAASASRTWRARAQPSSSPSSPWRARGKRLAGSGTRASSRTNSPPRTASATRTLSRPVAMGSVPPARAANHVRPRDPAELAVMVVLLAAKAVAGQRHPAALPDRSGPGGSGTR